VRVGLLDADVHGPSIPRLLGLASAGRPATDAAGRLLPLTNYGVRALSMGFLVDPGDAVVWRGPMVMSALETLTRKADWAGTDLLLIDMPPGTGDAVLSLAQRLPLTGALVVTTPSAVAVDDAARGARAWGAAGVGVLGLVQNMAGHVCGACGARDDVFGEGEGGAADAGSPLAGVPVLARVPLAGPVRASGDGGAPIVVTAPDSVAAVEFGRAAGAVWEAVQRAKEGGG
jgi:ATP-binding protein involved in chromosome partitioning